MARDIWGNSCPTCAMFFQGALQTQLQDAYTRIEELTAQVCAAIACRFGHAMVGLGIKQEAFDCQKTYVQSQRIAQPVYIGCGTNRGLPNALDVECLELRRNGMSPTHLM